MTKVEEVARAIVKVEGWHPDDWRHFEVQARAAIEALRVPTKAMAEAGAKLMGAGAWEDMHDADRNDFRKDASDQWSAMIDAALTEEQ